MENGKASSSSGYLLNQIIWWFLISALAGALSIVLHEFAHYLTARLFNASEVSFHWAYVDHDTTSVSSVGNALIALFGPLSSYIMVTIAWLYARKTIWIFWMAFGFSAAFRCLVVLPFAIKTLLGRDTSTFFFDEIRGASAFDISPLFFVCISLVVGFIGVIYFSKKTYLDKGSIFMALMIVSCFSGVYFWSILGSALFPGGPGFN